jgi:hypothetical protein
VVCTQAERVPWNHRNPPNLNNSIRELTIPDMECNKNDFFIIDLKQEVKEILPVF